MACKFRASLVVIDVLILTSDRMQWKPARNLKFAKDEGVIGIRKLKAKLTGGLEGRQPGVETETG